MTDLHQALHQNLVAQQNRPGFQLIAWEEYAPEDPTRVDDWLQTRPLPPALAAYYRQYNGVRLHWRLDDKKTKAATGGYVALSTVRYLLWGAAQPGEEPDFSPLLWNRYDEKPVRELGRRLHVLDATEPVGFAVGIDLADGACPLYARLSDQFYPLNLSVADYLQRAVQLLGVVYWPMLFADALFDNYRSLSYLGRELRLAYPAFDLAQLGPAVNPAAHQLFQKKWLEGK